MKREVSRKILDDAWRKIGNTIKERTEKYDNAYWAAADLILKLSGTTDIECPECKGRRVLPRGRVSQFLIGCPKCKSTGSIPYKWRIVVK